jgi:hypothetical protein
MGGRPTHAGAYSQLGSANYPTLLMKDKELAAK